MLPPVILLNVLKSSNPTATNPETKLIGKPADTRSCRLEEVFPTYKNTCPSNGLPSSDSHRLCSPHPSHCVCMFEQSSWAHTHTLRGHREGRKTRSRGKKKVIKISGRHRRGETSEQQQRRLRPPRQLASSVWKWACRYRGCRTVAMTLWLPGGHAAAGRGMNAGVCVKQGARTFDW